MLKRHGENVTVPADILLDYKAMIYAVHCSKLMEVIV